MPKTTITYTKQELADFLIKHLENVHKRKVASIEFDVAIECQDRPYGSGNSYAAFNGAQVVLGDNIVKTMQHPEDY